jgi:hypothetical protein
MVLRAFSAIAWFPRLRRSASYAGVCLLLILLTTFLLASSVPAKAALRIADDAPHARLWRQLYRQMPTCWKTSRTVFLQEVSDDEMDRLVERTRHRNRDEARDDSLVDGCYESGGPHEDDFPTITLRDSLNGEERSLVFTHEYGHFVWDEILTDAQRGRYALLWRQLKRSGHLVTEYAGDSEEEGFAECFAYSLRRPGLLQHRSPEAAQFLHTLAADLQAAKDDRGAADEEEDRDSSF